MKWGSKKHSPPSPSSSLLISRVFPVSWFSKFKQKGATSETNSDKMLKRGKLDFPTRNSSSAGWREAIFYSVDETRKKKGRINLLWYDSADEFQVPVSGFKRFPRGVHKSISDVVLDIEKLKEKQLGQNILRELRKKKPSRGAQDVNHQRSGNLSRGVVRKKKAQTERGDDNEEVHAFAEMEGEGSHPNCQNLENKKSSVMKLKPAYTGRRSHSKNAKQIRMKDYGSKTDSKIQVLKNMKKRRKQLKGTKEQAMKFNSFAAVKSSYNPEEDFRDSMFEMIKYEGIKRPEELQELLACYLTLNPDGYHDLIIKVFQQVWFELKTGVS